MDTADTAGSMAEPRAPSSQSGSDGGRNSPLGAAGPSHSPRSGTPDRQSVDNAATPAGAGSSVADDGSSGEASRPATPEPADALWQAARRGRAGDVARLLAAGDHELDGRHTPAASTALHAAAAAGKLDTLVLLHEAGADVNAASLRGRVTALHAAAEAGHVDVVRALLRMGADAAAADGAGRTATFTAAGGGRGVMLRLLHACDALDAYTCDTRGRTPLHVAAGRGYEDAVRVLYDWTGRETVVKPDAVGDTPVLAAAKAGQARMLAVLHEIGADVRPAVGLAARRGDLPCLRVLAECGLDLAVVNCAERRRTREAGRGRRAKRESSADESKRQSVMHAAARAGHAEVLQALHDELGCGDAVDAPDHAGRTPGFVAAVAGHTDVLRTLHALGANLARPDKAGLPPACAAVRSGRPHACDVLGVLAELGVSLEARDADGATAVGVAAGCGHMAALRTLHRLGADVNAADGDGMTPVCRAALWDETDALRVLVGELGAHARGAPATQSWDAAVWAASQQMLTPLRVLAELGVRLDKPSTDGTTPLSAGVMNGHADVVKLLVGELGVDVNTRGVGRRTALHAAAAAGLTHMAATLVTAGADVDVQDEAGATPVAVAAGLNRYACVQVLHAQGADFSLADAEGWTPAHVAAHNGFTSILSLVGDLAPGTLMLADRDGDTPLHLAAEAGHVASARELARRGVDLEARNRFDCTPAFTAALYGNLGILQTLRAAGADMVATLASTGATPAFVAADNNRQDCAKFLRGIEEQERRARGAREAAARVAADAAAAEAHRATFTAEAGTDGWAQVQRRQQTPKAKSRAGRSGTSSPGPGFAPGHVHAGQVAGPPLQ